MKEKILENMIKLMQAGYEIRMGDNWFEVIEIYKSKSREKWHEIKVRESCGSFGYWTDGALRIMADKLSEAVRELIEVKTEKDSQ